MTEERSSEVVAQVPSKSDRIVQILGIICQTAGLTCLIQVSYYVFSGIPSFWSQLLSNAMSNGYAPEMASLLILYQWLIKVSLVGTVLFAAGLVCVLRTHFP